jgi:hypothetical protein
MLSLSSEELKYRRLPVQWCFASRFVSFARPVPTVGTHKAEPTAKEMKKGMLEMMRQQPADTATAA